MATIEKPLIVIEKMDLCRNCHGERHVTLDYHIGAFKCPVCNGHGRLIVKKEIKITLKTLD